MIYKQKLHKVKPLRSLAPGDSIDGGELIVDEAVVIHGFSTPDEAILIQPLSSIPVEDIETLKVQTLQSIPTFSTIQLTVSLAAVDVESAVLSSCFFHNPG